MNVGIVTLPLHSNYGGCLQAFALKFILESLGHKVFFFARDDKTFLSRAKLIIKRIMRVTSIRDVEQCNFEDFKKEYFPNWAIVDRKKNKKTIACDAIVVGSDQVWRMWSDSWSLPFYFLDFAEKWSVKKIAYAASFGTDDLNVDAHLLESCSTLLRSFDAVSVRERSAVRICKDTLGCDADWVLDPTMLLDMGDYVKQLECRFLNNNAFISSYILDMNEEKREIRVKIEDSLNLTSKELNSMEVDLKKKVKCWPPIHSWVSNMMSGSFVVTDSFHGTAFAINFEKPFVVLSNKERGQSRLKSILNIFGLQSRLVTCVDDVEKILKEQIDWSRVRTLKQQYKKKSISFLKNI